jgi:uncharacterized membrane protein YfcA
MTPAGPDALALAVAGTAVFAGSVLQGAVGFGLALVAAPVLFMLDPRLVPGPLTFSALALISLTAWRDRQAMDFRGFGWGLLGRLPGTALGAAVLAVLSPEHLAIPLGVLVLLAVGISASGVHFPPNPRTLFGAGLLSGFMGTTSSIGGPPLAMVYQHAPGRELRGTLAGYFLVGTLMSLAGIGAVGRFGAAELGWGLTLMPGAILGFTLSNRVTPWIDRGYTRHAVLAVSAIAGLGILVRQLW